MDASEEIQKSPDRQQYPASSCISMKSEVSIVIGPNFSKETADRYIGSVWFLDVIAHLKHLEVI